MTTQTPTPNTTTASLPQQAGQRSGRPSGQQTRTALVTGGSAGLGLALVRALLADGWWVLTDARDPARLRTELGDTDAVTVVGSVADPAHRAELIERIDTRPGLDLLVNNASTLGPVPMRRLADLTSAEVADVFTTNTLAPLSLTRALLPALRRADGVVVSLSSDAAVEHYETWGAYAASKAALDSLTLTLAEETGLHGYAVDPGDMRTEMHQDAFLGEDISDRPLPETVVPRLLRMLSTRPASGRYRAAEFDPEAPARQPIGETTGEVA